MMVRMMLTCNTAAKLHKSCSFEAYTSIEPSLLTSFSCLSLSDPTEISRARCPHWRHIWYILAWNMNILFQKQQKIMNPDFFFLWNGALFPKCYPLLLQESHSFSSFFLPELPMTLEMCGTVAWLAQHTECIDRLANIQLQSALQVIAKQKV